MAKKLADATGASLIFIGFPIWYGAAPNVVNTFCKGYNWTGKSVHAFATSGGSGIGKTAEMIVYCLSKELKLLPKQTIRRISL